MPAGYQQRNKRKRRWVIFQHGCQQMALHMVNTNGRHPPGISQRAAKCRAHHQRTDQARPGSISHTINRCFIGIGGCKHLTNQWQQLAHMVARSKLRHHTTILGMHRNLAVQRMRKQAINTVINRHASLIAGGFNAQHSHFTGHPFCVLEIKAAIIMENRWQFMRLALQTPTEKDFATRGRYV